MDKFSELTIRGSASKSEAEIADESSNVRPVERITSIRLIKPIPLTVSNGRLSIIINSVNAFVILFFNS
jgi:hypothetical protein